MLRQSRPNVLFPRWFRDYWTVVSSVVWTRLNESRGLPEAAGVDRVVQLDNIHPDTFEALQILIDLPSQPVARQYVVRPDPPLTPRDVIELYQMFEQFEAKDEAYDLLYALVKRHAIALTLCGRVLHGCEGCPRRRMRVPSVQVLRDELGLHGDILADLNARFRFQVMRSSS